MSAITRIAAGENAAEIARTRFRVAARDRPAPDVLARHSRIALVAFEAFQDRSHALAFLNTADPGLGGRPIDIAGASDAGLDDMVAALTERRAAALRD